MKNAEAEREKELKAAQQKLSQAKSKADAFNKRLKEKQQVRCIYYSPIRMANVFSWGRKVFSMFTGTSLILLLSEFRFSVFFSHHPCENS